VEGPQNRLREAGTVLWLVEVRDPRGWLTEDRVSLGYHVVAGAGGDRWSKADGEEQRALNICVASNVCKILDVELIADI
jgi:hypothetical protein